MPEFEQWQRSFPFDRILLPYEVAASKAHASALAKAGVLTAANCRRRWRRSSRSRREGVPEADDPTIEDVHHYVETAAGAKLPARLVTSCTPAAAATSRLPPICGFMCARRLMRSRNCWRSSGRRVREAGGSGRRCGDAGLHASAACGAGAGGALAAGVCRDVSARCRSPARLPQAAECLSAGLRRDCRNDSAAGSRSHRRASWGSMRRRRTAWTRPAIAILRWSSCRRCRWWRCI